MAVMTDDGKAEKAALLQVWPNAAQYLCIFHVLGSGNGFSKTVNKQTERF
jgi:MULE transposase domain